MRTAIYRLYAEDGALLYAGITTEPAHRFRQHSTEQPWWPEVARKKIAWCSSKDAAILAEDKAIRTERPRYNILPATLPIQQELFLPGRPKTNTERQAAFRARLKAAAAERDQLRAENARLTAENDQLKAQVDLLKSVLGNSLQPNH